MTVHLIAAAVLFAGLAALFGAGAEIARLFARRRVERGYGREISDVYRSASPLFRLSRELGMVAALMFAAAAGVFVSLAATGAP